MLFTDCSGPWRSVFGLILLAFSAASSPLYAADTFEPNGTTATATPILVDSSRVSYISSLDDFDYYQLTVPGTQQVHVRLIMPGPVNYQMFLFDSAGDYLDIVNVPVNGVELRADWTVGPGTYFLFVRGTSDFDADNSYTLSVTRLLGDVPEPNDTPQSASALVVGTATTGYVFTSNDTDWYRFQVPFETHLDITLTAPANYSLMLYYDNPSHPDPWFLTYADEPGTNERIRWTVSGGTYWVRVSSSPGTYTQTTLPYSLRVDSGFFTDSYEPNNGRFGAALRRDTTIWSQFYTSNDWDWYRFGLSAGGTITLKLTVPSTEGMRLDVYDRAGNLVASAEGNGRDATLVQTLSGPGTYFVAVTLLYRSLPFPEQEYSLTLSGSTVGLPRRITGDFDSLDGADRVLYNPVTGIWTREHYGAFVQFGEPGDIPVVGDYNGDGGADHAVYRPSTGMWYVRGQFAVQYGDRGDIPVPADYNGDSVTDVAVYRPSTGVWYVRNQFAVQHGGIGAVPIPADYNGDGSDDVAVYRVTSGVWDVRNQFRIAYGGSGDLPVPGDYNGDGRADIAVFRTANGGVWDVRGQFTYSGNQGIPMPNDYNGDGTTDLVMYNPSTRLWFSQVLVLEFQPTQFGNPGDLPALRRPATIRATPGDYDGDGAADAALYRPSTGEWLIGGKFVIRHGAPGDLPAPADYDGDGVVDAGVFRPSTRQWLVRNQFVTNYVGDPGDIPVAGDYTGDGIVDVKVYRASNGVWFSPLESVQFGAPGDVPVQGDYNGDGVTDIAVYRPSTGVWYVRNQFTVQFGDAGDVPVPADYNGDGVVDIAVYRPSTGVWYVRHQFAVQFGDSGDLPVPGDYNNDGRTDVAVYRPATGVWYVRNQYALRFGRPGDMPLASLAGR